jgi:hypothetical protein
MKQLERNSKNRASRTDQTEQDCQHGTVKTVLLGQGGQCRIAGTGQTRQDSLLSLLLCSPSVCLPSSFAPFYSGYSVKRTLIYCIRIFNLPPASGFGLRTGYQCFAATGGTRIRTFFVIYAFPFLCLIFFVLLRSFLLHARERESAKQVRAPTSAYYRGGHRYFSYWRFFLSTQHFCQCPVLENLTQQ